MAWWFCSRIDRRQAVLGSLVLGMLAAGGSAALPAKAPDPAPEAGKIYVAFFLGHGGYLFSWGIPCLASEAQKLGLVTDIFSYTDVSAAWTNIVRKRDEGYKIALVGYSLGNTTATYLQNHLAVDLLLAISESSLGQNHPIKRENVRRSVLWYGPDMLSNAGVHDGFDQTNYIENTHLLMDTDPRVVAGVLGELKRLAAPEKRDEQAVAAKSPVPKPVKSPSPKSILTKSIAATPTSPKPVDSEVEHEIAIASAPAQRLSTGWLPPSNVVTPDVTCGTCWGFTQSLGVAGPDPWMQ
jgi:hypothetical protein